MVQTLIRSNVEREFEMHRPLLGGIDKIVHHECFEYFSTRATNLLFVLTNEGRIVQANAYACSLAGQDLAGLHVKDVIVDFHGQFDLAALVFDHTKEHLISVTSASGLPQSYYFTFKRAEEYILAFGRLDAEEIDSMRKEVLALNRDLTNLTRELHKKNAQLKKLNAIKNRFLGIVAHDLRHPISTIRMYIEFLADELKGRVDDEHVEFIDIIHISVDDMGRMVDDYLDIAKIESGRLTVAPEVSDLTALVESCAQRHRTLAAAKDVSVIWDSDTKSIRIPFDMPKMRQVIDNLLHNGVKFTPPGGEVEIGLEHDGPQAVLTVSDTGIGIHKDQFDVIFEPFGQVAASQPKKGKGTGLGLAIAKKIVDAHGGRIWVESKPGKGSTFYVALPLSNTDPCDGRS